METFELHRQSDGLVYHFRRTGPHVFQRRDNPGLKICWEGPWGWTARLPENGVLAGRPWEILPQHQNEAAPPCGVWVSVKDGRSYVYRLVRP